MTSTSRRLALALLVGAAMPAALAQQPAPPAATPTEVRLGICVLQPTQGNACRGVVRFQQVAGGVRVTAEITGLPPSSKHGFHVHERGDVSAPDGSSCGGHYNPEGRAHAGPQHDERHAGDLGNVDADAQGVARYEVTLANLTLAGPRNAIIGRSVVLHAQADDLSSQPAGNAGARIAVGVIGVAADTTPPTVTVLSPREGSRVNRNPVNVVVQAQDDQGVAGVTINGAAATPDASGPGRWKAALTATRGDNRVAIEVTDVGGNKAQAMVSFAFNDQAPTVQATALIVVEGSVDDLTCTLTINGQPTPYDKKTGAYSARVRADPTTPSRVTIVVTDEYGNSRTELRDLR